jgi:hypothetical protein
MAASVPVSCIPNIGETAGIIWQILTKSKGPMTMAKLVTAVGEPRDMVMLALGWLAREDKISIVNKGRNCEISLS